MIGAITPVAAGVSFASVAAYCWLRGDVVADGRKPSTGVRRARNGLLVTVTALIAFGVAASFPMARSDLTLSLRLPLAALGAVAAVALAFSAIAVVRQEEARFVWVIDPASGETEPSEDAPRHALHGSRTSHGWAAVTAVASTAMIVLAGSSPYVYPFVGLVLIPSLATWAYAALRMSRLDRRAAEATPKHPPSRLLRVSRVTSVMVLVLTPSGVLASVFVSPREAILVVTIVAGLAAAVVYPFLTVAEALRTPRRAPAMPRLRESDFDEIVAPLALDFVHGRSGSQATRISSI
jgi:hypothetical protein